MRKKKTNQILKDHSKDELESLIEQLASFKATLDRQIASEPDAVYISVFGREPMSASMMNFWLEALEDEKFSFYIAVKRNDLIRLVDDLQHRLKTSTHGTLDVHTLKKFTDDLLINVLKARIEPAMITPQVEFDSPKKARRGARITTRNSRHDEARNLARQLYDKGYTTKKPLHTHLCEALRHQGYVPSDCPSPSTVQNWITRDFRADNQDN